jgi:hypothetical protein
MTILYKWKNGEREILKLIITKSEIKSKQEDKKWKTKKPLSK